MNKIYVQFKRLLDHTLEYRLYIVLVAVDEEARVEIASVVLEAMEKTIQEMTVGDYIEFGKGLDVHAKIWNAQVRTTTDMLEFFTVEEVKAWFEQQGGGAYPLSR